MAADVLVVAGDPAADIRVLQDRSRLTTIISRGAVWDGNRGDLPSWPADRAQIFSTEVLTYDLVHGSRGDRSEETPASSHQSTALDQASRPTESELFQEITRITAASREGGRR